MSNITSVLNEQIRRLAKREITAQTRSTRRLTAQYRRDIAALKRQVTSLQKTVAFLERQEKRRAAEQPAPQPKAEGIRFRVDGLKSHRAKLGLSAKDYGRLVGVAGLTIYQWEGGKNRPRAAQLAKLAAVRGLGKREALKRLELLGQGSGAAARPAQKGEGGTTAKEFIVSLVRGRKASTTNEINAAWRESGRKGTADNTMSLMVKAGELKRLKNERGRGSKYGVAA